MHLLVIVLTLSGRVAGIFDYGVFTGDGSPTHARWECERAMWEVIQTMKAPPGTTIQYACAAQVDA